MSAGSSKKASAKKKSSRLVSTSADIVLEGLPSGSSGLDAPAAQSAVPALLLSVREGVDDPSAPNLPSIAASTLKILELVSKHRYERKVLISRSSGGVETLLKCLQIVDSYDVVWNILSTFLALSKYKHSGRLVSEGVVTVLLPVLSAVVRCPWCTDTLLLLFHSLISRLAPRDKKFGVKARLNGMLPITLGLLKNCQSNHHQLVTVLSALKLLAANPTNAEYLSKQGCIGVLSKLLAAGSKDVGVVRHCVEVLSAMLKQKSVASKPPAQGCVKQLLFVHEQLHTTDRQNRHLALRKAVLTALKSAVCTSSCFKTFRKANGLQILFSTATSLSEGTKDARALANLSCSILRKCLPKTLLPIASKENPIKFALPCEVVVSSTPSSKLSSETLGSDETNQIEGMSVSVSSVAAAASDVSDEARVMAKDSSEGFSQGSADESSAASDVVISESREECGRVFRLPSKSHLIDFDKFFPELRHDANKETDGDRTQTAEQFTNTSPGDEGDIESSVTSKSSDSAASVVIVVPTGLQCEVHATEPVGNPIHIQRESSSDSSDPPPLRLVPSTTSSAAVVGVGKFCELPAPQVMGHTSPPSVEPLYKNTLKAERKLYLSDVDRVIHPQALINRTVFDLDQLTSASYSGTHACRSLKQARSADDVKLMSNPGPAAATMQYAHSSPNLLHCANTGSTQAHSVHSEPVSSSHADAEPHTEAVCDPLGYEAVNDGDQQPVSSPSAASDQGTAVHQEHPHLAFESRFESGNLRKAIQVRPFEYDLILNSDINTDHHHQWFYFKISGTRAGASYRFNIINAEKPNSQFNFGMQPVMYSTVEALNGRAGWVRTGHDISYYRNSMLFEPQPTQAGQTTASTASSASAESVSSKGHTHKSYYTLSFAITFQHDNDTCYLAYHYPYTYSMLQADLRKVEETMDPSQVYYSCQDLCTTLSGNACPLLTITSQTQDREYSDQEDAGKQYIVLSARVHPGESNSSWIMAGILEYLVSDCSEARELRERFVFKVVPMLNPDGVINGSHRCSLSGQDLNRQWISPSTLLHPTVHSLKSLLQWLIMHNRRPLVFCDLHGHSRRRNIFMYGCKDRFSTGEEEALPRILDSLAPAFSYESCSFQVERSKEATARVVVWRRLGVARSYTMESTYCGTDQGPYKGRQLGTQDLTEMGRYFCMALQLLHTASTFPPAPAAAQATVDDSVGTATDSSDTDSEWETETLL